jgi:hypothetical protein
MGSVATARVLAHMRPDANPACPVCHVEVETLRHYFFECPRVREFWQLVGEFLDRIQQPSPTQTHQVELKDILAGLPAWKDKVPCLIIFHALAMWQIYRAHAEAALDEIRTPAIAMLARWQSEVMRRVRVDHINAIRNNRMGRFEANWFSIRCQWFVFESGGDVPGRSRVVFNPAFAAPRRMSSRTVE